MYKGKSIGVVVPALNEEVLIVPTLASMPGFVDRVYVVDDGLLGGGGFARYLAFLDCNQPPGWGSSKRC